MTGVAKEVTGMPFFMVDWAVKDLNRVVYRITDRVVRDVVSEASLGGAPFFEKFPYGKELVGATNDSGKN